MDVPADEVQVVEEIVVEGEEAATGAGDRDLDRTGVEAFPARSADELLKALPGLHLSAHGGQGKAYQVFLRGFDAEHGTAVAVDLEGIPLNEVNNVHGHGYLDLHLLPADLVQGVSLHAGVPRPEDGDFAVAGSASYAIGLEHTGLWVRGGGGSDRSVAGTVAYRPRGAPAGTFVIADGTTGEGAGDRRGWTQVRGGAGVEGTWGVGSARAFVLAYDGRFESPGALREDDLDELGLYGAYTHAGGGSSRRLLASARAEVSDGRLSGEGMAWAGARGLELQQDFTGFYNDPIAGDGTLQTQRTGQGGAEVRGTAALTASGSLASSAGVDVRHDGGTSVIERADAAYAPIGTLSDARTSQTDAGAWVEGVVTPSAAVRATAGARVDAFDTRVDDGSARSASAVAGLPRARVVVHPVPAIELSAGAGRALQSPEARSTLDGVRAPISLADTAEVGAGWTPGSALSLRGAGFRTTLDDELVFDHTVGRYVSGGRTQRTGVTGIAEVAPVEALLATVDVTWADGRFVGDATPIPYAPRWLASGGLFLRQLPVGSALVTGGLRGTYVGRRPLPDGFTSTPSVSTDLVAMAEVSTWEVGLQVDNVLGTASRDGEFVYASAWDRDGVASSRSEVHVTAGEPFAARVSVAKRFR